MDTAYRKNVMLKGGRTLLLRPMLPEDAAEMLAFVQQTDVESPFLTREPGEFSYTLEQEREIIAQKLGNERCFWIAAVLEGKLVGNCDVRAVSNRRRLRHRADFGLSVLQAYWGLGIGTALLAEAIAWCRVAGLEQLELSVVTENERGLALYKKMGFEVTGTLCRAHKNADGKYMDVYHMWKRL